MIRSYVTLFGGTIRGHIRNIVTFGKIELFNF